MAQVFKGFSIPFESGGGALQGILAFDDDHHDFRSAWQAVDLPDRAHALDDTVLTSTSKGLMYRGREPYGTCMFCPEGFRARASHYLGEDPLLVCLWMDVG